MSAIQKIKRLSVDEYLALERDADVRHEYVDGEIFAMEGASRTHTLITANVLALLHNHLRGGPCRVLMTDMKVHIDAANSFYYPDILVSCTDVDTEPDDYYETQPQLIVEVLSSSTEARDRMEKRLNYQHLNSLREYVLVTQDRPNVEIYRRVTDGWEHEQCSASDSVALKSIELNLSMTEIYEGALVIEP